jgi:hypothetical protein
MSDVGGYAVLIGLATLAFSALSYFAGVRGTEMRHAGDERANRIRRVVDTYMGFRRSHPPETSGPDGLQRAGIATLASNTEVQEVIGLIIAHGEGHPLGGDHERVFQRVDLLKLFRFAADRGINLTRVAIEDVIRDSGARG